VSAGATGFKQSTQENVILHAGEQRALQFSMVIAPSDRSSEATQGSQPSQPDLFKSSDDRGNGWTPGPLTRLNSFWLIAIGPIILASAILSLSLYRPVQLHETLATGPTLIVQRFTKRSKRAGRNPSQPANRIQWSARRIFRLASLVVRAVSAESP
jgi:hypothetical protein